MNRGIFFVEQPGILTTLQDGGRPFYQQYGVSLSGPMDPLSFQIANILLGNQRGAPALEILVRGPVLQVRRDTTLSLAGADLKARIDQEPFPVFSTRKVKKGQRIRFEGGTEGTTTYLQVSCGFLGEEFLGSVSTYTKANLGGKRVAVKDILYARGAIEPARLEVQLSFKEMPDFQSKAPFRVLLGPDTHCFTKESLASFFTVPFVVSRAWDRMGCRLQGTPLEHKGSLDTLSDAVTRGTIQVPADGQPLVLFADCQTTGGYPRIGTLISCDLPRFVQKPPGSTVYFTPIQIEEAHVLLRKKETRLKRLAHTLSFLQERL